MSVDLYWIPLGAGQVSVRFNGRVYERVLATVQRRSPSDIFHSVLELRLPEGRFMVEMAPTPDEHGVDRGVVVTGPVGSRLLRHLRVFRYEVRRWRDGVVPDIAWAVGEPVRVTDDLATTRRVFDALAVVPSLVWGRDELRAGEMWTCNSVISWALERAGVDATAIALPPAARAPGWTSGVRVAGLLGPMEERKSYVCNS